MPAQSQVAGPFKKLLVATDFSPHAEAALRSAVWLAQQSASELALAHVVADAATIATFSYEAVVAQDSERVERELRRDSDEKLAAIEQEVSVSGVRLRRMTLAGLPFVALTHAVQREGYDLVVCGSRGYSGFREFLVGSTAKRLIRNCPSDVWITHSGVPRSPTVVVAAVDFSELSRTALVDAHWVAQAASAPLHIVHVLEPRPWTHRSWKPFVSVRAPTGGTKYGRRLAGVYRRSLKRPSAIPSDLPSTSTSASLGNTSATRPDL